MSQYFLFIYAVYFTVILLAYAAIIENKWLLLFAPPLHLLVFDSVFYFLHIDNERTLTSIFAFSTLITLAGLAGSIVEAARLGRHNRFALVSGPGQSLGLSESVSSRPALNLAVGQNRAFMLMLGAGVLMFLYVLSGADVSLRVLLTDFMEFARFYSESRRGGAWLLLLVNSLAFGLLYIFFQTGRWRHGAMCVAFILFLSLQGGRGVLLSFVMMLILIKIYQTGSGRLIPVFGSLGIGVFLIASYLRTGDLGEYMNGLAIFYDFNLAFVYEDVVAYLQSNGTEWGLFLNDIVLYIPRAFWPDKPMSTAETFLIYPETAYSGTTYTFGLYGNMLLHASYFGLVAACLLYFVVGAAFIRFDTRTSSPGGTFAFIVTISMELLWLRAGIFGMRAATVLGTVLIGFWMAQGLTRWLATPQPWSVPFEQQTASQPKDQSRRAA